MSLFLASATLDALPGFLAEVGAGPRTVFVPTAANGLPDRVELVEAFRRPLVEAGLDVTDIDLGRVDWVALPMADVIVVSVGDPFALLAHMRRTGFDAGVRRAVAGGATYVGISAGALVAGPTLEPVVLTSPFAPAPGATLKGIDLTDRLVLPHADRRGRAERNAIALRRYGREVSLVPLSDDEALVVTAGRAEVRNTALGCVFRGAEPADAPAIADTVVEAGRVAWAGFLGADRVAGMDRRVDMWTERIAGVERPTHLLVASDVTGVVGFVEAHGAVDIDLSDGFGEIGCLYTRPRVWGRGIGRAAGARGHRVGRRRVSERGAVDGGAQRPTAGGVRARGLVAGMAPCVTRNFSASACANSATGMRSWPQPMLTVEVTSPARRRDASGLAVHACRLRSRPWTLWSNTRGGMA